MTAVTIGAAGPLMPPLPEWTVADLEGLPDDDGLQYELLDGLLLVTPAPVVKHQRVSMALSYRLVGACPDSLEVFAAPLDWRPDPHTSLQPDLLVVRKEDVGVQNITTPLVLAIEILSPSTRRKDLQFKRSKYEDCGVEHYWVIDPDKPCFTAHELAGGHYRITAQTSGDQVAKIGRPFPLRINPADLVTG